jgi:hypothetical protein
LGVQGVGGWVSGGSGRRAGSQKAPERIQGLVRDALINERARTDTHTRTCTHTHTHTHTHSLSRLPLFSYMSSLSRLPLSSSLHPTPPFSRARALTTAALLMLVPATKTHPYTKLGLVRHVSETAEAPHKGLAHPVITTVTTVTHVTAAAACLAYLSCLHVVLICRAYMSYLYVNAAATCPTSARYRCGAYY